MVFLYSEGTRRFTILDERLQNLVYTLSPPPPKKKKKKKEKEKENKKLTLLKLGSIGGPGPASLVCASLCQCLLNTRDRNSSAKYDFQTDPH